jgi:hypothetical protein
MRSPPTRMACDSWACALEAARGGRSAAGAGRDDRAVVVRGWYAIASKSVAPRNHRIARMFTHAGCYFGAK